MILFNLCGHGHFDLSAYERYLDGTLEDYEYPLEKVEAALAGPAQDLIGAPMPRLACWSCGRQIYTVAPLEALFAEERRCPRCGAFLDEERREAERRTDHRRKNPPHDPGRRVRRRRPSRARRSGRRANRRKPPASSRPRSSGCGGQRAPSRRPAEPPASRGGHGAVGCTTR